MGNLIYGQAIHHNEILQDIYLEDEDFEQYEYDEENDCYHFEDKEFDSDNEILEILLSEKLKISLKLLKTNSYDTFKSSYQIEQWKIHYMCCR
jgi:hypothetical protein